MFQTIYQSPLGALLLKANENALTSIAFDGALEGQEITNPILENTKRQLDEYFQKERKIFEIPLAPEGTAFQKSVWQHLQNIEHGQQLSYTQFSKQIGNILAIRAVANANGKNPIPIIIPCHRVVGSSGKLVGFSGGLWRKQLLLELEGNTLF